MLPLSTHLFSHWSIPLKGQCHEIFASGFFHESPSPKPLIITVGSFRIFPKIRGDIRKSRCTTGVNDTGGNDIGGKLPPVSTTPAQICHRYQRHRRQILPPVLLVLLTPVANLPPVSTIAAANLPPVSTTPVANCHRYQRHRRKICRRCR